MDGWNKEHDKIFNVAVKMNVKEQFIYFSNELEKLKLKYDLDYYDGDKDSFHHLYEDNFKYFNEIFDALFFRRRLQTRLDKLESYIKLNIEFLESEIEETVKKVLDDYIDEYFENVSFDKRLKKGQLAFKIKEWIVKKYGKTYSQTTIRPKLSRPR